MLRESPTPKYNTPHTRGPIHPLCVGIFIESGLKRKHTHAARRNKRTPVAHDAHATARPIATTGRTSRKCVSMLSDRARSVAMAILTFNVAIVSGIGNNRTNILRRFPECVRREARSQHMEDLQLLVPLLCMASHGAPATFVELGAFTGVEFSNTVMLEQCYNWNGILIEGNPRNYAKLVQSKRTAPKIHSAVCSGGDSTVKFAVGGDDRAGEPTLRPSSIKNKISRDDTTEVVEVPCTSFERLMVRGGQPNGVSMLFLDVEGAEAKVLATADLSKIAVILVEASDMGRHKSAVEPLLHAAGFERTRALEASSWNPVYVRKGGPMRQHCITCAKDPKCRAKALGT